MLATKYHPDHNPSTDTTIETQLLTEAYIVLRDSEKKL